MIINSTPAIVNAAATGVTNTHDGYTVAYFANGGATLTFEAFGAPLTMRFDTSGAAWGAIGAMRGYAPAPVSEDASL